MAFPSFEPSSEPTIPPARPGPLRQFSDADRRHILAEVTRPGASVSEIARRYGIERRVLFRWRQEQTTRPIFVEVEITDDPASSKEGAS